MMKRLLIILIICLIVILSSCQSETQNQSSNLMKESTEETTQIKEYYDYKLFYGEWEVMEDLGQKKMPPVKITGYKIVYKKDEAIINGEIHIPITEYSFTTSYHRIGTKQYNLGNFDRAKEDYYVTVDNGYYKNYDSTFAILTEEERAVLSEFIIIDNDTLALIGPAHLIKMKRISYDDKTGIS